MIKKLFFLLFFLFVNFINAQTAVKSPSEYLGYTLGTSFTRHYEVIDYFQHLEENSTQLAFFRYGKTYEGRPLSYAIITSEENMKNLETLRKNHLSQAGVAEGNGNSEIAVVWLSYNVHGNEASGTEAAMQTAYELLTTEQEVLKNTVIILDPCINPDGRDRYVNWYKQVKATPYNAYQDAVEHHEPWASGRPNHYLFDLNRDWMWATQLETQQRLPIYNQWLPHVHVDFHEQGINEPYYFAPAAEPFHAIITDFQRSFQTKIGQNNAAAFDKKAWAYFTRERFDLFYPSYGDTYPTYNGAIGMTYEQAGNGQAGLGILTDDGYELTLVDRIQHHVVSGITTVRTASEAAEELNKEFKKYFTHSPKIDGYLLQGEPNKLIKLSKLFDLHDIKYAFSNDKNLKLTPVYTYSKANVDTENALIIPAHQPKAKLLQVLFEADPKLSTPITYDITSWNLALAHGVDVYTFNGKVNTSPTPKPQQPISPDKETLAYIAPWKSLADAQFLAQLLQHNITVKATTKPIKIENKTLDRGSLIITKTHNSKVPLDSLVISLAKQFQISLQTTKTGFSESGTDLGSPDIPKINPQRIALLREEGVSTLSYGALWYFFEQELGYPIIAVPANNLGKIDLDKYDVVILPNGNYATILQKKNMEMLTSWVKKGGKIIALGNALKSFAGQDEMGLEKREQPQDSSKADFTTYAERELKSTEKLITGAIIQVKVDNTHPLAFGYQEYYATLKTSSNAYPPLTKGYNVAYIEDSIDRKSGFVGEKANEKIKNTLVMGEHRLGKGSIIYLQDEVNFRAFWENGKLFIANALFMVNNRTNAFR